MPAAQLWPLQLEVNTCQATVMQCLDIRPGNKAILKWKDKEDVQEKGKYKQEKKDASYKK